MYRKLEMGKITKFIGKVFSEDGQPSSSRILSFWLSVSSMGLIWFMVRHAFYQSDVASIALWVGGIPAIIYALAAFSVSPYGLNKIAGIWKKDDKKDDNPSETKATSK